MTSPIDEDRIAEAVRQAEAGTSAELVCVLARRSSDYEFWPLVWAILLALALPWFLIAFTLWSVERLFLVQLAVFAVALVVLSQERIRMSLVPRSIKRRSAHRAAAEQFLARGLDRKQDRTGVLIFVSRAERYARVIADQGVAARVDDTHWQKAIDLLASHAGSGRMTEGFIEAVALCGAVLAAEFPPGPGPANELSNRFHSI